MPKGIDIKWEAEAGEFEAGVGYIAKTSSQQTGKDRKH